MRYALVDDKGNIDRFATNIDPKVATRHPWRWLPAPHAVKPAHDPETQVVEGPTRTVGADVTESWVVRDKTAQELAAGKDTILSRVDVAALAVLLNHENRVRALEGKVAITAAQFRTALKAML